MLAMSFVYGVVVAGVLVAAPAVAGEPSVVADAPSLRVERTDAGLRVAADGARIEDVLQELAEKEGFEVEIQLGVERPPVDVDLQGVTLEEALRTILRRRNYAISYAETENGLEVSRVQVLLPEAAVQTTARQTATRSQRSTATMAPEYQQYLTRRRQQAEQRLVQQAEQRRRAQREARLAERRRAWVERARQAQRAREAQQEVPLRRLLWERGR
ncbi:MAG TPA: hypothetical protein VIS07_03250 [Candidatus Binatia bacterium]